MFQFFQRPSLRDIVIEIRGLVQAQGKILMAVSSEVQSALDKVTETVSLEKSVVAGLAAQATQITALNATIAQLQATIDAGGTLSADDIAALATVGQDLDTVNTALQTSIPANVTPPATAPAAIIPNVGNLNVNPLTGTP